MVTRIDAFAHVMPQAFYDAMSDAHPSPALHNLYIEPLWNLDQRLEDMDDHGIDRQVLTLANPPVWRGVDPEDGLALTRLANDEVHEMAAANPDRFIPVATLPFATADYLAEFDRCIEDLGMCGVQLFSNDAGRPIDSAGHLAIYEAAADAGVPVWIHPQMYEWYDWLAAFELHRTFGWPFDTTAAMGRLVFAGVFERFPDLEIIVHHLGGMVPFFIGRVRTFFEARVNNPEMYPDFEAPEFSTPIEDQFRRFTADTVIGGATAPFRCGHDFFGDDGVVFATDYPFGPDDGRRFMHQAVEVVESVDRDDARAAIFGGNLRSML